MDEDTSAYCQARARLPKDRLERILAATAATADRRAGTGGTLGGRPVKVVDGSSTQMPDTPENQRRYPQPSGQKAGCGFPVIKFLLLFSLNSGAVLHAVMADLTRHELRLVRQLQGELQHGDILLGDRAYGEYGTLASWPRPGSMWWPACTRDAASISARPAAWPRTMASSSGTRSLPNGYLLGEGMAPTPPADHRADRAVHRRHSWLTAAAASRW